MSSPIRTLELGSELWGPVHALFCIAGIFGYGTMKVAIRSLFESVT